MQWLLVAASAARGGQPMQARGLCGGARGPFAPSPPDILCQQHAHAWHPAKPLRFPARCTHRGPVFPQPLVDPSHLERLTVAPVVDAELGYVYRAITLTRHRLKGVCPLFGFTGSPWTLFAYAVEGSTSKTWQKAKAWLYRYPEESHALLQRMTDLIITCAPDAYPSWRQTALPSHPAACSWPPALARRAGSRHQ